MINSTAVMATPVKAKPVKLCRYFRGIGGCAFGDKCMNSHDLPQDTGQPKSKIQNVDSEDQTIATKKGFDGKSPCIFYLQGACAQGTECDFYHAVDEGEVGGSRSNQDSGKTECVEPPKINGTVQQNNQIKEVSSSAPDQPLKEVDSVSTHTNVTSYPDEITPEQPETSYITKQEIELHANTSENANSNLARCVSPSPAVKPAESPMPLQANMYNESRRTTPNSQSPAGGNSTRKTPGQNSSQYRASPVVSEPPSNNAHHSINAIADIPVYPHVSEVTLHWSQFADPLANTSLPFCKALAQGRCSANDSCGFRHSLSVDEYKLLFHDSQPSLFTLDRNGRQAQTSTLPPPSQTPLAPGPPFPNPPASSVCKFFPLGKCRNGDACPYIHEGPPPSTDPSNNHTQETSQQPCRYFTQYGTCKKGDSCYFSHGIINGANNEEPYSGYQTYERDQAEEGDQLGDGHQVEEGDQVEEDDQVEENGAEEGYQMEDNQWGGGWTANDMTQNWGAPEDNNENCGPTKMVERKQSVQDSTKLYQKAPCKRFAEGICNRGDACSYSHDRPSSSQPDNSLTYPDGSSNARKTRTCQYFSMGSCKKGDRCDMKHDTSNQNTSRQTNGSISDYSKRSLTICKYYATRGYCAYGDSCKFSHGVDSRSSQSEHLASDKNNKGGDDVAEELNDEEGSRHEANEHEGNEEEQIPIGSQEPNDDAEETWNAPWPEIAPPSNDPERVDEPCKAFGQGYCGRGDSCRFLHISPQDEYIRTPSPKMSPTFMADSGEAESVDAGYESKAHTIISDVASSTRNSSELATPAQVEEDSTPSESERSTESDHRSDTSINKAITTTNHGPTEPVRAQEHPLVERQFFSCTVTFGEDSTPTDIVTPCDSRTVILENLPLDSTLAEIRELASNFGEVIDVISHEDTETYATSEIHFERASQARIAAAQLHKQTYGDMELRVRVGSTSPIDIRMPPKSKHVTVSWPAATRTAWAYYASISKAKSEATRLNGQVINGMKVAAVFHRPTPGQTHSYAVKLSGLSPDTNKAAVERFCGAFPTSVTLVRPTYVNSPVDPIRALLSKSGGLDEFEVLPLESGKKRYVAFARFSTETLADEAAEYLNNTQQQFLADETLRVQLIYFSIYRVSTPILQSIMPQLDKLREMHKRACEIQCQNIDGVTCIRIHTQAANSEAFGHVNGCLALLLHGGVMKSGERDEPFWDDYFYNESSSKALQRINTDTTFFIQCDTRTQTVRIYGAEEAQDRARTLVLRLIKKVHSLQKEIQLQKDAIHALTHGGLKSIQDGVGPNKVTLDIVNLKLIVRGESAVVDQVRLAINKSTNAESGLVKTDSAVCQICLHKPVSPVKLPCGHVYCTACLQYILLSAAGPQYRPSRCFAKITTEGGGTIGCNAIVPYIVVRDLLTMLQENDFLKFSFITHIRDRVKDYFFCPTPKCPMVYRHTIWTGMVIRCLSCYSEICAGCGYMYHEGLTCTERMALPSITNNVS